MFDQFKKIKISHLYVGNLGYVERINKGYKINKTDNYIIYHKINLGLHISMDEYAAIDVFSHKQYYFFDENYFDNTKIHDKMVGGYAIMNSYPIEPYVDMQKDKISKKELQDIYNRLNKTKEENNKDNDSNNDKKVTLITDTIFKTILETSNVVKEKEIDEDDKQSIISELKKLAENYANDIENFVNKNNHNPFESEYQIRIKYINKLAEIDQRINDPNKVKTYSLKKQLNELQTNLK